MDKAYQDYKWHDRPNETTPVSETNLDAISHGLSIVDDRVIELYNTVQNSVSDIMIDEKTGEITYIKNNGATYQSNLATKIYNTMKINQQAVEAQFAQISGSFDSVENMLAEMDSKIDLNAEFANAGIENLQTTITENDGYYRSEMTGISHHIDQVEESANVSAAEIRNYVTNVASSITQTTQAIQLSVSSVTRAVGDVSDNLNAQVTRLDSRINVTAGDISLKVSKLEVLDDLTQEFNSSAIQLTPSRITFASTGALVVNTTNFKLDELGNAMFGGTLVAPTIVGTTEIASNGEVKAGNDQYISVMDANGFTVGPKSGDTEKGRASLNYGEVILNDYKGFAAVRLLSNQTAGLIQVKNETDNLELQLFPDTIESRYSGLHLKGKGSLYYNDYEIFNSQGQLNAEISASSITGTLNANQIPNLPATKITSGTLSADRLPSIPATKLTGTIDVARLPSIPASKISGSIPIPSNPSVTTIKVSDAILCGSSRYIVFNSNRNIVLNGTVNIGNGKSNAIQLKGYDANWESVTIGGKTYRILTGS